MKLSVAMATYNGEKYIIEQMESIRVQTLPVDEVIISDDHSTDATCQIVEQYIKKHNLSSSWMLIENVKKGVVNNFYNSIAHTSGDIVLLCDQDDTWLPEKVEKIVKVFMDNKDVKCVNTSFEYIDQNGKMLSVSNDINKSNNNLILHHIDYEAIEKIPFSIVFNKNISPGMTMAFTKEIAQDYLKCSKKRVIHDWEINCISAVQDGLYFYNSVLTLYRIHAKQTISIGNIKHRRKIDILKQKIMDTKRSINSGLTILEEVESLITTSCIRQYWRAIKTLYETRNEVVFGKRIYKWPKEYKKYREIIKKEGNIDIRYCYIDLLAILSISSKR